MPALSLLIKPASGNCNMRCRYCFYADELDNREIRSYGKMSVDTMHTIVDKAMEYGDYECTIAFQGGEPTLAGLDFYRDLVAYVTAHENPKKLKIHYALQTNGYLINEEWAAFLGENHFLVGVSLDGLRDPRPLPAGRGWKRHVPEGDLCHPPVGEVSGRVQYSDGGDCGYCP